MRITDHIRLFRSLNRHRVKYLVVGGFAAIVYGVPRTTADIDLLIEPTLGNAERLLKALKEAGFGTAYLIDAEGVLSKQVTIFADYMKVDVLTSAPGIEFAPAWKRCKVVTIESVRVKFVSLDDLIATKQAAGRAQDLEDVAILEPILEQLARRKRRRRR